MASQKVLQTSLASLKTLKQDLFQTGSASRLPEVYQKFWREWKWQEPAPVHYIPEPSKWKRNPETGEVKIVQNFPIPLKFTPEMDNMLLGGEAIVKGFEKRHPLRRRVPRFWVPVLKRSVVHSEILGSYMPAIVTERMLRLIHEHHGFDFYLLKTSACDLRTELALKIKRKVLIALATGDFHTDNPQKKDEMLKKYAEYIMPLEEAQWYGLTLKEAMIKQHLSEQVEVTPLKLKYRKDLYDRLKTSDLDELSLDDGNSASWLAKMNPFASKETPPKQ